MPTLIELNKWCLKKEQLLQLIVDNLSLTDKSVCTTVSGTYNGKTTFHDVARLQLRSYTRDDVFYELMYVSSEGWPEPKVFINVWTTVDGEKKYSCVYENGRIVRSGDWITELVETLPELMGSFTKTFADNEQDYIMEALHGPNLKDEGESWREKIAAGRKENGRPCLYDKVKLDGIMSDFLQ